METSKEQSKMEANVAMIRNICHQLLRLRVETSTNNGNNGVYNAIMKSLTRNPDPSPTPPHHPLWIMEQLKQLMILATQCTLPIASSMQKPSTAASTWHYHVRFAFLIRFICRIKPASFNEHFELCPYSVTVLSRTLNFWFIQMSQPPHIIL